MLQKILRDFTRRREDMNFMLERQEQHVSNDLFVLFCFVLFCFVLFLIKSQIDSTELYLYLTRLPES